MSLTKNHYPKQPSIVADGDNYFPFVTTAIGAYPMGNGWSLAVGAGGVRWCHQRMMSTALPFSGFGSFSFWYGHGNTP